jgi:kinetochore protein Mis12/MTW1
MSGPPHNQPILPTTLVPELLGFSPQMLLDDIIDAAADANMLCMQAMEPFMQRWADGRIPRPEEDWDGQEAVEQVRLTHVYCAIVEIDAFHQGLVAFATLLESHTDIAFDFFEAWSLRNIFALPPDLPIVAPHHKGLDLQPRAEEETELMVEVEELRRKIENVSRYATCSSANNKL